MTADTVSTALHEIVTNGRWSEGEQCGEWCVSKDVYDLAYNADLFADWQPAMTLTEADEAAERIMARIPHHIHPDELAVTRAYQSLRSPVEGLRDARDAAGEVVQRWDDLPPSDDRDYVPQLVELISAAIDADRLTQAREIAGLRAERDEAGKRGDLLFDEFRRIDVEKANALARAIAAESRVAGLEKALTRLVVVIKAAGLQNLMNGVQLGQISWYVKANDAVEQADAALALPAHDGGGG